MKGRCTQCCSRVHALYVESVIDKRNCCNWLQNVEKACNGSYWNATEKICLENINDIYAVLVVVLTLLSVRLCSGFLKAR
jgi:hypothetical protein